MNNSRYIAIIRHGTKQDMNNRLDLPIYPEHEEYCNTKSWSKLTNTLNNSPNKKVIYSSPFLRTRQTAGRLGKKLDYKGRIRVVDGLGESYNSVMKELSKCDEDEYRIPRHITRDSCLLSTLDDDEIQKMKDATNELKKYKFVKEKSRLRSPKNKKEQMQNFKKSVCKILKDNPDKDIVIVTHGLNVRKSTDIFAPNRIATTPNTCGGILYQECDDQYQIADYDGIFLF